MHNCVYIKIYECEWYGLGLMPSGSKSDGSAIPTGPIKELWREHISAHNLKIRPKTSVGGLSLSEAVDRVLSSRLCSP